ncbi:MAG TPA: hypothetical protein VFF16_07975 [Telluria sp.]|nr:hypothetical protein [Telluria sp.]
MAAEPSVRMALPIAPSLSRPLALSLANQAVASGGNFLLGIYLARTMPLADFGLYGLCYGVVMLYIGVGNALLLTHMSVGMADKADSERAGYAARILCAVAGLGVLLVVLAALAAQAIGRLAPAQDELAGLLVPTASAAALFLCWEFFIALAYVRRKEREALLVNAVTMGCMALTLTALRVTGAANLDAGTVLLVYGASAGVAALAAFACAPLPLRQSFGAVRREVGDTWRDARWALGGVAITWAQTQSYSYALALLLGPAGVGLANLGRIFISPFSFLIPAVNKIVMPRLAGLRATEPQRVEPTARMITGGLLAMALAYSVALAFGFDRIAPLVLGREVADIAPLAGLWCLVLYANITRTCGGIMMQSQRRFRQLTLLNLPSAVVTIALAVLLVQPFGAAGAILAVLGGEVVLAGLIWRSRP